MKSKQEIEAFLKKVRVASEEDRDKITDFLRTIKCVVRMKVRKTKDLLPLITYDDFIKWFEKELPQKGDVIVCTKTNVVGLIKDIDVDSFTLGAYLQGNALVHDDYTVSFSDYRMGEDSEILKLQQAFSEKKYRWSRFRNMVMAERVSKINDYLRISRVGIPLGYGVFKEINADGDLVMYCVLMEGEPVRHSLHEVIGKASDFQLDRLTPAERAYFDSALKNIDKVWNGHLSRIEPVASRVKQGETYLYLSDTNEITKTIERGRPRDFKRWSKGNYYTDLAEIEQVLSAIVSIRKRQYAE